MAQFPDSLRGMHDTNGSVSMVDEPDVDAAVFVRVLRDVPGEVRVRGTDVRLEMRRGDVYVVRWNAVKEVVERGDAELL
jgi:GINS complex subunit 4